MTRRNSGTFLFHLFAGLAGLAVAGCAYAPPITRAIVEGDEPKAQALAAQVDKEEVDKTSAYGDTALFYAAQAGDEALVKALIAKGADVNHVSNDYVFKFTPVLAAAEAGQLGTLKLLLAAGGDVNATTSFGWSAVSLAALYDQKPVVQFLQEKGVAVTPKQYTEIEATQRCDYNTGRADGYNHNDPSWGDIQYYRTAYCKADCDHPWMLRNEDKDPRPTRAVSGSYKLYCATKPTSTPYAEGYQLGWDTKSQENAATWAAVQGGLQNLQTNMMNAGSNTNMALAQSMSSLGQATGQVADRAPANFTGREHHARGCPDWAPWLHDGNCYGTERQACHGQHGCGAVNE